MTKTHRTMVHSNIQHAFEYKLTLNDKILIQPICPWSRSQHI